MEIAPTLLLLDEILNFFVLNFNKYSIKLEFKMLSFHFFRIEKRADILDVESLKVFDSLKVLFAKNLVFLE